MALLRRCLTVLLGISLLGAGTASTLAAAACLPGRAWLVRGAVLLQDPAAGAALTVPAEQAVAGAADVPQATPVPTPQPSPPEETPQSAAPAPTPTPQPAAAPLPSAAPELEDPGAIRAEHFEQGSGAGYITLDAGSVRNLTDHSDADLRAAIDTPSLPFAVEVDSSEPQVLILHTHATETYQTWPDLVYDPEFARAHPEHRPEYVRRRRADGPGAQRRGH